MMISYLYLAYHTVF